MVEQLTQLGRIDWLRDDFAALEKTELYETDPKDAWLKIKGKNKLTNKQLAIVQAVAHWREHTAQTENRPKSWLLRDDLLFDIAKLQPDSIATLSKVRGINERVVNYYGKELCALIKEAQKNTAHALPVQVKKLNNKNQQHEAIIDILFALVRIRAEENLLNPSILASRHDLETLLAGDDAECILLHGWRFTMVGNELQQLLRGELQLKIENDCVRFIAS